MCGVIGAILRDGDMEAKNFLQDVIYESRVRGLDSFGHAICTKFERKVSHGTLSTMINEAGKSVHPCLFLGHCRYSTSGATPQPLAISSIPNMIFAFNGNIHMGTKEEMEQHFKIKMDTDNDGEVFMRLGQYSGMVDFIKNPAISFAGVWIENNMLFALRNEHRPLWRCDLAGKNVFIASTADIFYRAGADALMLEPIEPNKVFCLGAL
jgi:glutamine phosphoribosylpyrophosphate amidotransferase